MSDPFLLSLVSGMPVDLLQMVFGEESQAN